MLNSPVFRTIIPLLKVANKRPFFLPDSSR
nr:MAG TPA: hypothetical protein [Caudoviricetes sp.]DAI78914.1 MAG TPA: hypothetical protein [Caudoviricetes sp.]DAZ13870.1 MAG TPA: hypothetical protein [Caudoviricetes sp.]